MHLSCMADSFYDVSGTSFSFGSEHGGSFRNAAERFPEVAATAYERDTELSFVDVVNVVSHGEYFTFIDVVDFASFQDLGFNEVTNACLSHNWNGDCILDFLDQSGIGHSSDPTIATDIGRNTFQRHHCDCACCLCNLCLLYVHNIHDYPTLEHLCKTLFHSTRSNNSIAVSVSISVSVCTSHDFVL